jgi:hypothetical protein
MVSSPPGAKEKEQSSMTRTFD